MAGGATSQSNLGISNSARNIKVAALDIIDQEDLTPGLKGIDADNNGIRDDIDRLIAKKYSTTPELKKAAEQKARNMQQFMEAMTRDAAFKAANQNMRAFDCAEKYLPLDSAIILSKEVEALTANTKERFIKYWDSNRLVGGEVFGDPMEPVCD
jgi:hypothetical protein